MTELSRTIRGGKYLTARVGGSVQLQSVSEILGEPTRWLPVWDGENGYAHSGWSDFTHLANPNPGPGEGSLWRTPAGLLIACVEIPEHERSER